MQELSPVLTGQTDTAARIIREGGVVAFPTETVYGLGADALNPVAVARIFALKERPSFDPLIVHIASLEDLSRLTVNLPSQALQLAEKFWPGPLTLVLPKSNLVPDIVTSGLPTVGIRMPDNDIALEMIRKAGCPVAAPSANKFGQLSPTHARHVKKQIPDADFILEGGTTTVGIESTIVSLDENLCTILRHGKITSEDIRKAIPGMEVIDTPAHHRMVAPGLMKSHYSPQKPLHILNETTKELPDQSGLILHHFSPEVLRAEKTIYTSSNRNLLEVAANLFSALHQMEDDPSIKQIFIEPVEESGIGKAIMDRLKKASYRYQSKP